MMIYRAAGVGVAEGVGGGSNVVCTVAPVRLILLAVQVKVAVPVANTPNRDHAVHAKSRVSTRVLCARTRGGGPRAVPIVELVRLAVQVDAILAVLVVAEIVADPFEVLVREHDAADRRC